MVRYVGSSFYHQWLWRLLLTHQSLFHAAIHLLKFPNKWKGLLIQSATVCFVEVTDKLADCRSEQLRSGVKIRPRTNQRLFLQTITIVNKSAQTMFNISFYNFNWHLFIWRAKVGLNICRFYTFGNTKVPVWFFLLNIFEIINLSKVVFFFLWREQNPAFLLLWVSEIQIEGCWRKHTNISNHWWVELNISPSFLCEKIMFRNICCFYIFKHRKVI